MPAFLRQHDLSELVVLLNRKMGVYAPGHSSDAVPSFIRLQPGDIPELSLQRTLLPPKKYLIHPHETLLQFSPDFGYRMPDEIADPSVLLGIHPCDLASIAYLDKLLLEEHADKLYAQRRSNLTLIGISCEPDQYCSCKETASSLPAQCDVFLHAVEDGWIITTHSERGSEIVNFIKPLLQSIDLQPPPDRRRFFAQPQEQRHEPEWLHPAWEGMGEKCLGCGACSVVCPTCSCFDVKEHGGLDDATITRVRSWDNCLLASHSRVAGNFSFQKNRRERFQYRYRHKYLGFGKLRGTISCTGCGRCRAFCPVKLDLRLLERELRGKSI